MAAMLSGAVLLLQKPSLEIMSLGSGPAREVIDALTSPNGPRLRPTCVDVDQGALDYASSLARGAGVLDRIRLVRENIIRLSLGRGSFDTSPQDLIYSLGLIDYLRDELVVSLLSWIHGNLRPGGIALVGNFARSNPNRAFMDHILEWRLFHRDPDDLRTLFAESQFGDSPLELGVGDEGVQLYARCRKAE